MNSHSIFIRTASTCAAVAALAAPFSAMSAPRNDSAAAGACNAQTSTQSRADCLYEARSVMRDKRMGKVLGTAIAARIAATASACDSAGSAPTRQTCAQPVQRTLRPRTPDASTIS